MLSKSVKFFTVVMVCLGIVTQTMTMIKSGLLYSFGMGFWGANAHDGLWHIALINQLAKGSLTFPTFSGTQIVNYHIGFDLFAALIHKLTFLPVSFLYFQFLPVVFSFAYGFLSYFLALKIFKNKTAAVWTVFFAYFGGSLGWLVNLFKGEPLGGESMFWSMQSVSFLINPPFIFSVIILFLGLICYLNYYETGKNKFLFLSSLLFGILIQVKVYAGIIVLGTLAFVSLTEFLCSLFFKRKILIPKTFFIFLFSFFISLLVFLPLNRGSQSILVYKPWWFIETMFSFPDRFNWSRMEALRQIYVLTNASFKYFRWLVFGVIVFLLGNLGSRVIGVFWFFSLKNQKIISPIKLFLVFSLFISFFASMLFIQRGTNWNTIQFFYYFLVIFNFLSGWSLAQITRRLNVVSKVLVIMFFIFMTIPTTFITFKNNYLPSRPPARISKAELEGLKFLTKKPEGIVLTYPYDSNSHYGFVEPRPVFAYTSTAYVSALSGKVTFLEDEMNLGITNQNFQQRLKDEKNFFMTNDKYWARDFLVKNKIHYIYLVKPQKMTLNNDDIEVEKIFENGEALIYRVRDKI